MPKVATPTQPSDFRPISITPVLSRSPERFVARKYIYPALLHPIRHSTSLTLTLTLTLYPASEMTYIVSSGALNSTHSLTHSLTLDFRDQFAFRPSGSITAAIVAIMHTVRSMLSNNDYVHVFAFNFSKAFDTVSHTSLTNKLAQLAIPDSVYNWLLHFFWRPRSLHSPTSMPVLFRDRR